MSILRAGAKAVLYRSPNYVHPNTFKAAMLNVLPMVFSSTVLSFELKSQPVAKINGERLNRQLQQTMTQYQTYEAL